MKAGIYKFRVRVEIGRGRDMQAFEAGSLHRLTAAEAKAHARAIVAATKEEIAEFESQEAAAKAKSSASKKSGADDKEGQSGQEDGQGDGGADDGQGGGDQK